MLSELLNADFSQRVVIATNDLSWIASPQAGVERRPLDRIGGEVARATSLVRYAPGSLFPAHAHPFGEEFLVLEGTFSDEHGNYAAGTYVRNPPGSHHSPRTLPGCVILVKLRQMALTEQSRTIVDTTTSDWRRGEIEGHEWLELYAAGSTAERVSVERLSAGAALSQGDCPAGEEIFVLSGELFDQHGAYVAGSWIRNPPGYRRSLGSMAGARYWAKRGHLAATH
jgi:anti-sigma factor ChrR (cupin superfamily)